MYHYAQWWILCLFLIVSEILNLAKGKRWLISPYYSIPMLKCQGLAALVLGYASLCIVAGYTLFLNSSPVINSSFDMQVWLMLGHRGADSFSADFWGWAFSNHPIESLSIPDAGCHVKPCFARVCSPLLNNLAFSVSDPSAMWTSTIWSLSNRWLLFWKVAQQMLIVRPLL